MNTPYPPETLTAVLARVSSTMRSGQPLGDAIRSTMRSAGRTVVFSAVTVAVSLAALAWFPLPALRSIAYAGVATADTQRLVP
jgi:RND superfamily putative drug exporter